MTISFDCLPLEALHDYVTWRCCLWKCVMVISHDASAVGSASWLYHLTLLPFEVRHGHITWRSCLWKCVMVISLDAPAFGSASCSYELTLLLLHDHITWPFCLWKYLIIYHLMLLTYRTSRKQHSKLPRHHPSGEFGRFLCCTDSVCQVETWSLKWATVPEAFKRRNHRNLCLN